MGTVAGPLAIRAHDIGLSRCHSVDELEAAHLMCGGEQRVSGGASPGREVVAFLDDVCVVFASPMPEDLQFVGRQVAFQSWHPTPHREDENLESNWKKATGHGGSGLEMWNPQRLKVLATLAGTPDFHEAAAQERLG